MHTSFRFCFVVLGLTIPLSVFASFKDVNDSYPYKAAIEYAQERGVVGGYSDGTFRPNATVNRAEFLKILVESTSSDEDIKGCMTDPETDALSFKDVPKTAWFAPYVCYGSSYHGMYAIKGYPDGTFKPAQPISFVEAAKIIASLRFNVIDDQEAKRQYWFSQYVQTIAQSKLIPSSIQNFGSILTRGEMAEMMYRAEENPESLYLTYDDLVKQSGYGTIDVCIDPGQGGGMGRQTYPRSPTYDHLTDLGEIFTAAECGSERLKSTFGGEDAMYLWGSRIILRVPPSPPFQSVLESIGFQCTTQPCTEWSIGKVSIEQLLRLKPYSQSIVRDDCTNCG